MPRLAAGPTACKGVQALQAKDAAAYGHVKLAAFPWTADQPKVPDGTADVVLTFRNVHNWRMGYQRNGQDYSAEAFAQMFAMLKPGGVLGIEDHRLPESASAEREKSSGYMKVSTVRRLAEQAGFKFVARPKSTPIPGTPPTGPKASGRCRPATRSRMSIAPNMRRSARATG
jgi:predicted methyltransferase